MPDKSKDVPLISYELGSVFTWSNPDQPNQKGWALNEEVRTLIADGAFEYLVLALNHDMIRANGGLGGIEVSFNSLDTGFCMDFKTFPWNWDRKDHSGGYISYTDLMAGGYVTLEADLIKLKYYIRTHPNYSNFKKAMTNAKWGELSIQYGIGINILPYINAYLQG